MKFFAGRFAFTALAFIALFTQPAAAQRVDHLLPAAQDAGIQGTISERIAAVVNDNVITASDVENRYRLALLSSNLPDDPDTRRRIMPQVMQSLIDEQIQLQEARRLDINVTNADITNALDRVAKDNGIPMGMRAFLLQSSVSPTTLENQMRANLSWIKVVQRVLRPRVEIGDEEVDAVIERMCANAGKHEYLVGEIYLSNDNPAEEALVQAFAEKLRQQIDQGTPFGAVARQFSQGTGAMNGGDLGWIQQGQLPTEIDNVLRTMDKGQVAGPIKSANGYHIIAVRDLRTISIGEASEAAATVVQVAAQVKQPQDRPLIMEQAKAIRTGLQGCADLKEKIVAYPGWRFQDMGERKMAEFPDWLAEIAKTQKIGEASDPVPTGAGVTLFYVCGRVEPSTGGIDRDAISNAIGLERLENLARRQLRDLRRTAYIDIRS